MHGILKIRDENGNFVEFPALVGKSAYDYAVEGGYQGTEADFIAFLNGFVNMPSTVAVSTTIGESKSTLKIDIGNHIYVRDKYDADVPDMGVISNFTHYITIDENGKVTAVMSIPIDHTNKAYYYTRNDKKWHEICDAKPASGTYVGNGETAERQIQIGGAGKVLLVTSERGMAFVQEFSGRGWGNTSTAISLLDPDKAKFVDGVLTLKTESAYLNDTGITYYYTVL